MTRDEVLKLLHVIDVNYPNWNYTDEAISELADMWAVMLAEDDAAAINAGLMNYITNDTSGFAPTIGQIRSGIRKLAEPYDDTEEAMAQLRKALGNSGYNSRAEYERLPADLQKAVGLPENLRTWSKLSTDQLEVVMSHVRKAYRNIKAQKQTAQTMQPIKNEMLETAQRRVNMLETRPAQRNLLPEQKKAPRPAQIPEEPKPREWLLKPEEKEAVIEVFNRSHERRMPLSDILISPARDRILARYIAEHGLEDLLEKIQASEAPTFGQCLEETGVII